MKGLSAAVVLGIFLTFSAEGTATALSFNDDGSFELGNIDPSVPSSDATAPFLTAGSADIGSIGYFRMADKPDEGPTDSYVKLYAAGLPRNVAIPSMQLVFDDATRVDVGWITSAYAFCAFIAEPAAVSLNFFAGSHRSPGSSIDDVSVAVLPLPAALPLFAMGLAALLIFAHLPRRR